MSRPGYGEVLKEAVRYAAGIGGNATGMPHQTLKALLARGWAERHPYGQKHALPKSSLGRDQVHTGIRITEAGFAAVGLPHRCGSLRMVFLNPARPSAAKVLVLACADNGRLRVVLSDLNPRVQVGMFAPGPAAPVVREFDGAEEAVDTLERAVGYARGRSFASGAMVDPGHVSWDGPLFSMEDVEALESSGGLSPDAVVDAMRQALAARVAPEPAEFEEEAPSFSP